MSSMLEEYKISSTFQQHSNHMVKQSKLFDCSWPWKGRCVCPPSRSYNIVSKLQTCSGL